MKKYPRLDEMGVNNPQEIEKFLIYTTDDFDILRIIYERKKGSLLPVSKNYKFPRIKKSVLVDSGTRQTEVVFESAPAFREALSELEQIKTVRDQGTDLADLITEEVRLLEEDVALRIEYIKSLIKKVK
jgi:hypothetical protein